MDLSNCYEMWVTKISKENTSRHRLTILSKNYLNWFTKHEIYMTDDQKNDFKHLGRVLMEKRARAILGT